MQAALCYMQLLQLHEQTQLYTDKVHENVHCIFLDMSACLLLVGNTLNRGNGHISTYNEH